MKDEVLETYVKLGALKRGHFLLSSGKHSDVYLQSALVLQYPKIAEKLCGMLASRISYRIDVVVGPALGAVVLSYELARILGARSIFTERDAQGKMVLRRGFSIDEDENVLIVDDVITTGGSVLEVLKIIERGNVLGFACLVNRGRIYELSGLPVFSLIEVDTNIYEPENCPLCNSGIPLEVPGTKRSKSSSSNCS